jgi:putative ABC transport system permease protein
MFQSYLKIALRNIVHQKSYSFINIIGLAIGITCCILILLYVQDELSYDRYHANAGRIYRVGLHGIIGSNEINGTFTAAPMAEALMLEFPEVEQACRIRNFGFPVIRYEDKVFSEERFFWADSNIFEVFSIPFIQGDPKTALTKPLSVVITESAAKKYFGDENPMGKILNADNRRDYMVTGVMEDVPHNSHFHFDFLRSLSTNERAANNPLWISNNYQTYVLLKEGHPAEKLEAKFVDLVRKYVGPQIEQAAGISYDQLVEAGGAYGYFLQPLTDIHLYSHLEGELEPNGDATYVYGFAIIAFAILLIACINFMNLATARSTKRAREVGIRKTLGSNRAQLIRQFLAETIFMSFISVLIALVMVKLLLPYFNNLAGKQLVLDIFGNPRNLAALAGLVIFVGLLAGSYPAFFLASFQPVKVLKSSGLVKTNGRSPLLRSALVVFQFLISIILIIGTFVVRDQIHYIQNKNLGYDKAQVVVIEKTDDIGRQIETFKEELAQQPGVINASNSNVLFGQTFSSNAHILPGASGEETHLLWTMRTDYNFVETYQVEMAAGRFFSRDFPTDSTAVVLNEAAVRAMGLEDPVGKEVIRMGPTPEQSIRHNIIGIVKDLHFESLRQEIRPMAIKLFGRGGFGRNTSVRIATENVPQTLDALKTTWHKFAGNQAFEYVFFDEEFSRLYAAEQRTGQILTIFSMLAIFIACLGLFGLASFTTEQRTKEIGIRKALGASVTNVVRLLFKEFAKWVAIATVIAWAVSYFAVKEWLQNFAYRVDINLLIFLAAALLALVIAFITVSYQTVRAAVANPVDALRYE